jgi:DNA-binding MarR family transcriptional regulator
MAKDMPAIARCAAGTLRRATRSMARVYDARLACAGLTTTQLSILRALERSNGRAALSKLAEELVFERTSLYRALEPLRRDGLIGLSTGKGRTKHAALTRKGAQRLALAMPHWLAAQDEFLTRFGRAAWSEFSARLVDIVAIARAMPVTETPVAARARA